MSAVFQVDTSRFEAMIRGLTASSSNPEKDFMPILENQAAQLLGKCIDYTPKRKPKSLQEDAASNSRRFDGGGGNKDSIVVTLGKKKPNNWMLDESTWFANKDATVRTPAGDWQTSRQGKSAKTAYSPVKEGRSQRQTPPRLIDGRSWHLMNGGRKWSDQRWGQYQSILAYMQSEEAKKSKDAAKARGLVASSWFQSAKDLGLENITPCPAYVQKVNSTFTGKIAARMGSGSRKADKGLVEINFSNFSRLLTGGKDSMNGRAILQRAMETRVKAFRRDLTQQIGGVVTDWVKRYPGFTVKTP